MNLRTCRNVKKSFFILNFSVESSILPKFNFIVLFFHFLEHIFQLLFRLKFFMTLPRHFRHSVRHHHLHPFFQLFFQSTCKCLITFGEDSKKSFDFLKLLPHKLDKKKNTLQYSKINKDQVKLQRLNRPHPQF